MSTDPGRRKRRLRESMRSGCSWFETRRTWAENGGSRQPGWVGGFCFSYVMYVASCVGQPVKLGTGAAAPLETAVSMRGTMQ